MSRKPLLNPDSINDKSINIYGNTANIKQVVSETIIIEIGGSIEVDDLKLENLETKNATIEEKLEIVTTNGNVNYTTPDVGQPNFSLHTDGSGNTFWSPDDTGSPGITYDGSLPVNVGQHLLFSSTDAARVGKSVIEENISTLDVGGLDISNANIINSVDIRTTSTEIALSKNAGDNNAQPGSVCLGNQSGENNACFQGVFIGNKAGGNGTNDPGIQNSVCIGRQSGQNNYGLDVVAIGVASGQTDLQDSCVSIGAFSGSNSGAASVYIGRQADGDNKDNCVVINASGSITVPTDNNQIYLKAGANIIKYDDNGLDVDNKKIINCSTPVNPTDVANKQYIDDIKYVSDTLQFSGTENNIFNTDQYFILDGDTSGSTNNTPNIDNQFIAGFSGTITNISWIKSVTPASSVEIVINTNITGSNIVSLTGQFGNIDITPIPFNKGDAIGLTFNNAGGVCGIARYWLTLVSDLGSGAALSSLSSINMNFSEPVNETNIRLNQIENIINTLTE